MTAILVNESLVGNMQDSGDQPSSDEIMVQVCIQIVNEGDRLSQWSENILWDHFFNMPIDSVGQVKLLVPALLPCQPVPLDSGLCNWWGKTKHHDLTEYLMKRGANSSQVETTCWSASTDKNKRCNKSQQCCCHRKCTLNLYDDQSPCVGVK